MQHHSKECVDLGSSLSLLFASNHVACAFKHVLHDRVMLGLSLPRKLICRLDIHSLYLNMHHIILHGSYSYTGRAVAKLLTLHFRLASCAMDPAISAASSANVGWNDTAIITNPIASSDWTTEEHARFLEGLKQYGRSWESISTLLLPTRTPEEIKNYASLYLVNQPKDLTPPRTASTKGKDGASAARAKEGHWTDEEHEFFLKCWAKYGKSWKKISQVMKTRSNEQIRTHAQKYFTKLDQLRTCGYEGSYTMDGTRHLTKTFLKKAQCEGRLESGSWRSRFKLKNPRGVAKRHANRRKKVLARIRGSSGRSPYAHRHWRYGDHVGEEGEEEGDDDEEDEVSGSERFEGGHDATSVCGTLPTYTTRSGRVVTFSRPSQHVQDTNSEAEENEERSHTTDGIYVGEMTTYTHDESALSVESGMTIDTGVHTGRLGMAIVRDDDVKEHHAPKEGYEELSRDVSGVSASIPTPRTMVDVLSAFTMDPEGFPQWEYSGRREQGASLHPWTENDTVPARSGSDVFESSTKSVPQGYAALTSSVSSAATSAGSNFSDSSCADGLKTQRDDMVMMMCSADDSFFWESESYNEEQDDDNSLTRPPVSPNADAANEEWISTFEQVPFM